MDIIPALAWLLIVPLCSAALLFITIFFLFALWKKDNQRTNRDDRRAP